MTSSKTNNRLYRNVLACAVYGLKATLLFALLTVALNAQAQTSVITYDPGLGTLPEEQGFMFGKSDAGPNPTVSNGILYQGLTGYSGGQIWQRFDVPINFDDGFDYVATLKVISSTYETNPPGANGQRSGYYMDVIDQSGREFTFGIASTGLTLNTDTYQDPANGVPFVVYNTTTAFHEYRLNIAHGVGSIYVDNVLMGSTPVGSSVTQDVLNRVYFGDGTNAGSSQTELKYLRYVNTAVPVIIPESSTLLLLLPILLFSGIRLRQGKLMRPEMPESK